MTHSIDIDELSKLLSPGNAVTLLDVRRKMDYEANPRRIAGSEWRDPERIDAWVKQVPSGRRTLVYCVKGGSVSQSAADRLQQEGLDAAFLEGGLKKWIDSGRPVEAIPPTANRFTIRETDIDLLRKAGVSEEDIAHSVKVAEKALEIAARVSREMEMELVGRGALFHDLGKARTHEIEHGRVGAEIGLEMGLPASITAVMEKHIRGGLTAEEAVDLGLPVKDYALSTLEERVIIYADRLVDIITDGIVPIREEKEAEEKFEEILRTIPKYGKNDKTLDRYLKYHREIQGLINS